MSKLSKCLGMDLRDAIALVTALAFRLCNGSEHDVSDLTQDVFERLSRTAELGTLEIQGNSTSYLYRVTYNRWVELHRRRTSGGRTGPDLPISSELEIVDPTPGPDIQCENTLLRSRINQLIDELPNDKLRRVARLTVIDGMSRKEIADLLGEPPTTIGSRQAAAAKELRSAILRRGGEL